MANPEKVPPLHHRRSPLFLRLRLLRLAEAAIELQHVGDVLAGAVAADDDVARGCVPDKMQLEVYRLIGKVASGIWGALLWAAMVLPYGTARRRLCTRCAPGLTAAICELLPNTRQINSHLKQVSGDNEMSGNTSMVAAKTEKVE